MKSVTRGAKQKKSKAVSPVEKEMVDLKKIPIHTSSFILAWALCYAWAEEQPKPGPRPRCVSGSPLHKAWFEQRQRYNVRRSFFKASPIKRTIVASSKELRNVIEIMRDRAEKAGYNLSCLPKIEVPSLAERLGEQVTLEWTHESSAQANTPRRSL